MPGRMLVGSIACFCGQAHHLAMRLRRRHLRGTAVRRMHFAGRASARPPAKLPGSQRAPAPVDSHLIYGVPVLTAMYSRAINSTSRDSELVSAPERGDVDHPPAAVAGDIDIEAGHLAPRPNRHFSSKTRSSIGRVILTLLPLTSTTASSPMVECPVDMMKNLSAA